MMTGLRTVTHLRADFTQAFKIQDKICFGLEALAHAVVTVLRSEDART